MMRHNPISAIWRFWIAPVRAEPAAAFRITIALIVLLDTGFSLLPWTADWFGPDGLYPADAFKAHVASDWRWSIIDPDWGVEALRFTLFALMAAAALSVCGLLTRAATIVMWVLLVSVQARNPIILNGGDILLRAAAFYLMLMPAGASWSLDNVIRRRVLRPVLPGVARKLAAAVFTDPSRWGEVVRGEPPTGWVRPWSLRLAQIQLCVVYFFTGVDKLRGVNLKDGFLGDWLGGHAAYRALNHGTIGRFALFGDWPWWLFAPGAWLTLAWEIAFPVLVLWARTRWYALAIGVLLHIGIVATMEVTHFSFTTLAFYWLFVPAAILMDNAGKGTGELERRKYVVFYDEMCPVCKKSKRTLERLDWLKRLTYADIHNRRFADAELPEVTYADMLKQMYVKRPDGRYLGGYDAFRAMAAVLPLGWPAVPFLWLPGARFVGKRVYAWIARNRFKYAKCDNEFCSLHLKLLAGKEITDDVIAQVVELHRKYQGAANKGAA